MNNKDKEAIKTELRNLEQQIKDVTNSVDELVKGVNDPKNDKLSEEDQGKLKALLRQREALDNKMMSLSSKFNLADLMNLASEFGNDKS